MWFAVWREEIKTKTLFGVLGGILVLFNSWLTTSKLQTLDSHILAAMGADDLIDWGGSM